MERITTDERKNPPEQNILEKKSTENTYHDQGENSLTIYDQISSQWSGNALFNHT